MNNMIYQINQKPPFGKNLVFAFQQMIAIMAATLLVPILISGTAIEYKLEGIKYVAYLTCDPAAAFFGAGLGTIVYLLSHDSKVRYSSARPSRSSARSVRRQRVTSATGDLLSA